MLGMDGRRFRCGPFGPDSRAERGDYPNGAFVIVMHEPGLVRLSFPRWGSIGGRGRKKVRGRERGRAGTRGRGAAAGLLPSGASLLTGAVGVPAD